MACPHRNLRPCGCSPVLSEPPINTAGGRGNVPVNSIWSGGKPTAGFITLSCGQLFLCGSSAGSVPLSVLLGIQRPGIPPDQTVTPGAEQPRKRLGLTSRAQSPPVHTVQPHWSVKYVTETAPPSAHWDPRLSQDPETKRLTLGTSAGSGARAGGSSNASDVQGLETQEGRSRPATETRNTRPLTFPEPHLGN